MPYTDEGAPFQGHSSTSEGAALAIEETASTLRAKVLDYLRTNGPATDEQVQLALGMNGSTERPRRIELLRMGRIEECGEATTKAGRRAVLWRVRTEEPAQPAPRVCMCLFPTARPLCGCGGTVA